jgi:acetylornithine deacetylase/succinyl-diaminopimelate desuccinylase-like protein
MVEDHLEQLLNRTWRPTLSVTGAQGLPRLEDAGNVLRPLTALKLSFRVPPTGDLAQAVGAIQKALEKDPPYGARVRFEVKGRASGWDAPATAPWLADAVQRASRTYFDRDAMSMGEGGTIPFMGMLGEKFPRAQFVITGVLGPHSNAHGPNEFLHIPTGKRVTSCVAQILHDHAQRSGT